MFHIIMSYNYDNHNNYICIILIGFKITTSIQSSYMHKLDSISMLANNNLHKHQQSTNKKNIDSTQKRIVDKKGYHSWKFSFQRRICTQRLMSQNLLSDPFTFNLPPIQTSFPTLKNSQTKISQTLREISHFSLFAPNIILHKKTTIEWKQMNSKMNAQRLKDCPLLIKNIEKFNATVQLSHSPPFSSYFHL